MYEHNKVSSGVRHVLSIDSPSVISVGENEVASSQLRGLGDVSLFRAQKGGRS
jgi:hypothetical protein